jgi:hypothetical protein
MMRLVGLRNEATAAVKQVLNCGRQLWKRTDRQMADKVWGRVTGDDDLTGFVELGRGLGGE